MELGDVDLRKLSLMVFCRMLVCILFLALVGGDMWFMGFAREMLRSYECYFEVCLGVVILGQLGFGAGAVLVGFFWVLAAEFGSTDGMVGSCC